MAAPITITLRYFSLLREQAGIDEEKWQTTAMTPRVLYAELVAKYAFSLVANQIGIAINNSFANMDVQLKDGDVLAFIPPIAGG